MKNLIKLFILVSVANLSLAAGPKVPYTHTGFYSTEQTQKAVHFVSI